MQQRILDRLSQQAQTPARSAAFDGFYFSDLIATTHLIKLAWPMGAEFLPSASLAGIVESYVEPFIAQITAQHQGRLQRVAQSRGTRIAPSDSVLCGALLAAADVALGNRELATLRPRVQPLAREAYRRARSYASGVCRSTEISQALARATAKRIHGLPVRARLRTLSFQHRFRVEEIPSFLPRAWFDQHFAEFIKSLPRFDNATERHLRRGASLRLAELKSGATWDDCAPMVGMPLSLARRTLKHLGRQLELLCLWPAFEETVEQIAAYLDATSQRVDFANRRAHLASWRMPLDDWLSLSEGLPRLEQLRERANPAIGSALVWAEVTEGERMRSPVVLDLRRCGEDTQALAARLGRMSDGVRGPSLRLRRRLHLYAERLAFSCDKNLEQAVSVREVICDEVAAAAGVVQEERPETSLDTTSRGGMLNRTVCELTDPVGQMTPDLLWKLFQYVVPAESDRARNETSRRIGNREALAAIVFASTSGCGWLQLPSGFGLSGRTAFRRFSEWSEGRVWTEVRQRLHDVTGAQSDLDWSRHAIDAVKARADKRERGRR
ncbi:transposase [Streptomyces sp. NPDC002685]|uniref:transposase n=1 Tax=Streptomyces sp. NPDC002685 TaxID=3154540 RepID=UPI003332B7F9